jgi:uncharacterized protein
LFTQEPITDELVASVTRRIVDSFHPRRIIAFGSYARGEQRPDSDLDLIIEMETDKPFYERGLGIVGLFRDRKWAMDLLVYPPQEFAELTQVFGSLPYSVEREAALLTPVTDELVAEVTRRIVERFHPQTIIAFGSYARGEQTSDSDWPFWW